MKGRPLLDETPSKTRKLVSTQRDRLAAAAAEAAAEVEALQDSSRNEFLPSLSERETELDISEPEPAVDHPTGEGQWVWHGQGTPVKAPTPREEPTPIAAPVTATVVPVAPTVDIGKPKTSTVARRLDIDYDAAHVMVHRPARRLSDGGNLSSSRARSTGSGRSSSSAPQTNVRNRSLSLSFCGAKSATLSSLLLRNTQRFSRNMARLICSPVTLSSRLNSSSRKGSLRRPRPL